MCAINLVYAHTMHHVTNSQLISSWVLRCERPCVFPVSKASPEVDITRVGSMTPLMTLSTRMDPHPHRHMFWDGP